MDIQVLGAWGEFIGGVSGILAAVGVIVTLLYLARQVQDNTKSVQSTAYEIFINTNATVREITHAHFSRTRMMLWVAAASRCG